MTRYHKTCFVLLACAAGVLTACSGYEYTLNDQPLYKPEPLYSQYHLEDPALKDCVRQTIADRQVTQAEDLSLLVCTNAGITSLEGLTVFRKIRQLNLAHNLVTDVSPLAQLAELQRLDLSDNGVKSTKALWALAHLEKVNLKGNSALNCDQADQLAEHTGAAVQLPEHCH